MASIPGAGGVVDLTDDTDIELQKAMEASLQDSYFPSEDHGVSALMQQQQQELLSLYKSQQVSQQAADSMRKPFKPSSDLTRAHQSNTIQQQQPKSACQSNTIQQQQQPESAFASWVKPWRADPSSFDSQSDPQKAGNAMVRQADSERENSLKLSLDLQCSDESTTSAEHSLSPQHKSGANSIPASQLATPTTGAIRLPVFGSGQAKQGRQPTVATWPTAAASFAAASANGLRTSSASQASPVSHPNLAFPAQAASPVSTCPLGPLAQPTSPVSACPVGPSDCPASPVKPVNPASPSSWAAPTGSPVKAPRPSSALNAHSIAPMLEQQAAAAVSPSSHTALQSSMAHSSSTGEATGHGKASIPHASHPATLTDAATADLKPGPDTSPAISSSKEVIAPNKRRKLGTLQPPPGLLLGSRAKQAGQASLLSRQSRMRAPAPEADSEDSDAQSHHDVQGPANGTISSSDHSAALGNKPIVPAVGVSLSAAQEDAVTATEGKGERGEHNRGNAATAKQLGQDVAQASPAVDTSVLSLQTDTTGLADDTVIPWKGKGVLWLSPVLEYVAEQPSSLDHTKPGSWVWWKLGEATWMLAKVKSRFVDWLGLLKSFQVSLEDGEDDLFYTELDKVFMHFHPGSRVNIKGPPLQQGEVLPVDSAQFDGVYSVRTDAGSVLQVNHCDLQLLLNPWAECSSWVRDTGLPSPLDCPAESPLEGPPACSGLDDPLSPLHRCDSIQQQQPQQHHHHHQRSHSQQQQQQTHQQPQAEQPSVVQSGRTGRAYANTNSLSSLVQSVCQQQGFAGKQAALRQCAPLQSASTDARDTARANNLAHPPQASAAAAAASLTPASAAADKSTVAVLSRETQQGKDEKPVADAQKLGGGPTLRRRTKESVMARKRKLSEHSCGTFAEGDGTALKSARRRLPAAASQGPPNTPTPLAKTEAGNGDRLMGNPPAMFESPTGMSHVSSPASKSKLGTGTGHVSSPMSPSKTKSRAGPSVDSATANDAALAWQLADEDFMDCLQQHDGGAKQHENTKQHDCAKQKQPFDDHCDVDEYIDWAGTSKTLPSISVKDSKATARTESQAVEAVTPNGKSVAKQISAVSPSTGVKDSKLVVRTETKAIAAATPSSKSVAKQEAAMSPSTSVKSKKPAVHVQTKAPAAVTLNSKPLVKPKPVVSPQRKSSGCKTRASSSAALSKDSDDKGIIVLDSD